MSSISQNLLKPDFFCLHLDINGTIVIGDSTKKLNTLIGEVAGVIKYKWDENRPEMSYKDYVQKVALPGNKYDERIKVLQEEKIGNFLNDLKNSNHSQYERANKLYEDLATRYLNTETQQVKFSIFPSIINLINKVKKYCPFSITIRTFGFDGPLVAEEFKKNGIEFNRKAEMVKGGIQFDGEKEVRTGPELLKTLQESNTLGKDDVEAWLKNQRQAAFGKIIPCVADAQFNNKSVLTLFLDDNLKKREESDEKFLAADPKEQNIAFPQDVYGRPTSWNSSPGFIGIRINAIKAALEENYVIEKVNKQFIKRGFAPLPA